jgi:hypothetical protein
MDRSHAAHRQPQDPTQRGDVPHQFGEFYPLDDIIAVLDDERAAGRAHEALVEAGVPAGDIDVISGDWFIEHGRELKQARGFAERLAGLLASEERGYVEEYEDEARQGHALIAVHAVDDATAERVRQVLAAQAPGGCATTAGTSSRTCLRRIARPGRTLVIPEGCAGRR